VFKVLGYIEETSDVETGRSRSGSGLYVLSMRRATRAASPAALPLEPTQRCAGPLAVLHGILDIVVDGYQASSTSSRSTSAGREGLLPDAPTTPA
jgi:hypothetical protein